MSYGNYAPFYRGGYFNPMQTPSMSDNQSQFSQPYQTPVQTPLAHVQQNPTAQPPQQNSDIIWVQGEAGAKAYLIAPNNTVTLWDSENPTIYVKSADINGIPSMRVLDFTERVANAPQNATEHVCKCKENFVTKEQFAALQTKFDNIAAIVNELKTNPTTKSIKEEE